MFHSIRIRERERERGGIKKTMEKSRIRSVISRGVREKHADSLENNFVGKLIKSFRFGRWKLLRRMHLSFCQITYRWIYLNLRGEGRKKIILYSRSSIYVSRAWKISTTVIGCDILPGWHSSRKGYPLELAWFKDSPPLFIKSRSCYWIFPGNKNIGANRRLSPEEENEKFITDSRRCVHFEFICRKIFIDHRAWLMNRWISIDATLINHPRKKRELNRASRIPRSANNGIFP